MNEPDGIEIRPFEGPLLESTLALCRALDWPSYAEPEIARRCFTAPGAITCCACEADEVVGLAHLLSNGAVHAHLSLVGVHKDHRRRGIARALILRAFAASGAKWVDLIADPGSEPFYRSFVHQEMPGFRIHPSGAPR